MKIINTLLLLVMAFTITGYSYAQEQETDDQLYLIMSKNHFNLEKEDFNMDRWVELEKEYRVKVVNNNDHIENFVTFTHDLTDDSSEVIHLFVVKGWNNIKKMEDVEGELRRNAWPDREERRAFFQELNSYYTSEHSDEIYYVLPPYTTDLSGTGELVVRFRVSHAKYPLGPVKNNKEIMEAITWSNKEVLPKNEYVKGHIPLSHAWGSSGTEYLQIWLYSSMDDMDKAAERMGEIMRAAKTEEELKEWAALRDKYFTKGHADYLYTSHPELSKRNMNNEVSK